MEILRLNFNILPEEELKRRAKIKHALSHCKICDGRLDFSYFETLQTGQLEEVAHCVDCGRKAMNQLHSVH